jgi:hypothetical protein
MTIAHYVLGNITSFDHHLFCPHRFITIICYIIILLKYSFDSQGPTGASQTAACASQVPATPSQVPAAASQGTAAASQGTASVGQVPASASQDTASASQCPARDLLTPSKLNNFNT